MTLVIDPQFWPRNLPPSNLEDDAGWRDEYTIKEGVTLANGFPVEWNSIAMGETRMHAAVASRLHFILKLNAIPIGQG